MAKPSPGSQQGHDGCQFSNQLQHDIEELNGSVPLVSVRVLLVGIDDLETARERDAQAARDGGKPGLGLIAVGELQGRSRRQAIEDRLPVPAVELDVLVPYDRGDLVARVHERGEVLGSEHTGEGTELRVRVDRTLASELAPYAVTVG